MNTPDNAIVLLPQALETKLAAHFGVDLAGLDIEAQRAVIGRHAKQRHTAFQPDAGEKRAADDGRVRELAARWLDQPYRALERLRVGGAALD